MLEVIFFIGVALLLLKFFGGTSDAEKPIVTVSEPAPSGYRALTAGVVVVMALMGGAAVLGVGDTATYAAVRAGGGDDAVTMFAGCIVVGLGGLLMLINGIAPKLGLLIFLGSVVLSVMVSEVTMLGVTP